MNKGDLISRSNFEKNILQAFDSKLNEHDAKLMVEFLDYLDDEPTAYNVDKVVEQIVTLHVEGHCPSEDDDECILNKTCNDCFEERVKNIVKAGGVNG